MIGARNALLLLVLVVASGCGSQIKPYKPRQRQYDLPAGSVIDDTPKSTGSLWREGHNAAMLFTDARALRVNDLVVVKIEEVADARRNAQTDLSRSSAADAQITAFMKAAGAAAPNIDPKIAMTANSSFNGDGSTARTEKLTATVSALVRKVLPNGNLFIEGHRVILMNQEEHHFYISGVVRPRDIDERNSVYSSMVADAEIEFTGSGVLSENEKKGWMSRFLGWLWPF